MKTPKWSYRCCSCHMNSDNCFTTFEAIRDYTEAFASHHSESQTLPGLNPIATKFLEHHAGHGLWAMGPNQIKVLIPLVKATEEKADELLLRGLYCRTCGESLPPFTAIRGVYPSAVALGLVQAVHLACPQKRRDMEENVARQEGLSPAQVEAARWITRHAEHDLWGECHAGALHMAVNGAPEPITQLFDLFKHQSGWQSN